MITGGSITIPNGGFEPSGGAPFNGNFASLFPGAYQVVQTDLGLTYGGTMLATGTTPPVITLTGSLAGTPVPIEVDCTGGGALGAWFGTVSFDGGATVAQAFTSAATVPLVGAGTGLTLNIAAGTATTDNVWKATCAGLADQSGNALHYAQATAAYQPVIGVGANGKPSLVFNGLASDPQCLDSALNLPAPGTTPFSVIVIGKLTIHANDALVCSQPTVNGALIYVNAGGTGIGLYNGIAGPFSLNTVSSFSRIRGYFSSSAADTLKVGASAEVTGTATGNAANTGRRLGANGFQTGHNVNGSKLQLLAAIHVPGLLTGAALATLDAALNSAAGYGVGAIAV